MKKIYSFLTSMKFGLILLGVIIAVSLAGSLIPQNNEVMYYVRNYPDTYNIIFTLRLHQVFKSWYFLFLVALLCINLAVCTFRRLQAGSTDFSIPESFVPVNSFQGDDEQKVRAMLKDMHCRETIQGNVTLYTKNEFGMYGSLILHAGILLTVVFWVIASVVPKIMDKTCRPGESLTLDDGTVIRVDSFSIEDATGKLDYASDIEITLPDGRSSGIKRVSVNHPAAMGEYKVYQQTYGTQGKITVTDTGGHQDTFYVESQDFLSADGINGIWFDDLYPGYTQDENGALTLITSTSGHYENPVYVFVLRDQTKSEQMLAFPGDSVTIGEFTFHFDEPVEYPGLRIKKSPAIVNFLLLLAVIILTAGLYMIFFAIPVRVLVSEEGCTIVGRNEALSLQLKHILENDRKEERHA